MTASFFPLLFLLLLLCLLPSSDGPLLRPLLRSFCLRSPTLREVLSPYCPSIFFKAIFAEVDFLAGIFDSSFPSVLI